MEDSLPMGLDSSATALLACFCPLLSFSSTQTTICNLLGRTLDI